MSAAQRIQRLRSYRGVVASRDADAIDRKIKEILQ
jgi:hypothetical protein